MHLFIRYVWLVLIFFSTSAFSFSVEPMFLDMSPSGGNSRSVITVRNSSPRPLPVKAHVFDVVVGLNGDVKKNSSNGNNFIIFPPQAIIQPHSQQAFRVQWIGQPNLPVGRTYEVSISQIPAKDSRPSKGDSTGAKIKLSLALAFGSVINMNAALGEPKPIIQSTRLSRSKRGKPVLDVVVRNRSNQNFLLVKADSTVTVFGANNTPIWSYMYTPTDMLRYFGLGTVQPHKSRRMKIPLPNLPEHIARQAKSVKLEIRPSEK